MSDGGLGACSGRQDDPETGRCDLLKMLFLSAPAHYFRAWMVGKTSLLESDCDVASSPRPHVMMIRRRQPSLP
jgi:hypothetical protein